MTIKDCESALSRIKSSRDMVFWLAHLRDLAAIRGEYITRNAYDATLYYLTTGRLSGENERNLALNIRTVVKHLNKIKDVNYEMIGNYLKSFT